MRMLAAKLAIAFAIVALATPALACSAHKTTTADAEKKADRPASTARAGKQAEKAAPVKTAEVKASQRKAAN